MEQNIQTVTNSLTEIIRYAKVTVGVIGTFITIAIIAFT